MRQTKSVAASLLLAFVLAVSALLPAMAPAQSRAQKQRQKMKNEWRNLAIGSGALAVLGLIKNDKTLMFAGVAGALYSADRYEKDRKSQKKMERARYSMFRKRSFKRNGHTYVRRTVYKSGKKYYQFVRRS